jgi:hypothetical protein
MFLLPYITQQCGFYPIDGLTGKTLKGLHIQALGNALEMNNRKSVLSVLCKWLNRSNLSAGAKADLEQ